MSLKNKKIIVTGGRGFIGSNLVQKLVTLGAHVCVVDIKPIPTEPTLDVEHVVVDIRDAQALTEAFRGYDAVVHLAARASVQESLVNPEETTAVNIGGTLNVLQAAKESGAARVVFASSCSIYGNQETFPYTENMLPEPKSPYALHKLTGEHLMRLWNEIHGIETLSFRFFNVYGPLMDPTGPYGSLIGRFLMLNKQGKTLTIAGDGTNTRDYVHVDDITDAIVLALEKESLDGRVINLGNGIETSVNDIADIFGGSREYSAPRIEPKRFAADISLAQSYLGWSPKRELRQSLEELKAEPRFSNGGM